MRNAILIMLAVAAVAAPAAFASGATKGDGTLSVRDGNGKVLLSGRVSVLGRLDSGRIFFTNLEPTDLSEPDLFDTCDRIKPMTDLTTLCIGTKLRFRLLNVHYKVSVIGRGINLSAVGKGQATIEGADATFDDGDFAANGAPFKPITDTPVTVPFGTPAPSGP